MTLTVPVSATGDWTATFISGGLCQCGKPILVIATCTSDAGCVDRLDTPLRCEVIEPQPCNSTGDLTVTVDGCAGGASGGGATATFTFTIVPPIAGCTYEWTFGDGSPVVTTTVPTVTHVYMTAGSFSASVVAACPVSGGGSCFVKAAVTVTVPPCGGCPTVTGLTATVSGCAGPGGATATFNGTLVPPLVGCSFLWAFGDGGTLVTTVPSASHVYTVPGTYAVAVTAICPGITPCATTTIAVDVPRCCPVVTNILANVEDNECANGMGTSATVNFSAITDPTPAVGNYTWSFGDATPPVTNPGPNASHEYASPGAYTVQVVYAPNPATYPGCPSSPFSVSGVTVPACPGDGGGGDDEDDGGGEGWGCFGLRAIMTIAAILAIVAASLAACIPAAATPLLWLAAGLGLAAAIAAVLWGIFCPKPCAWALLLAWQVALGVGFILLCFTVCCPTFWVIGLALVGVGVALMFTWKKRCNKSNCAVLKELVIALSGVVLPLLGWLGAIPALAACINTVVTGALSTLAAAIAVAATNC
jgi:PKD repeat protein